MERGGDGRRTEWWAPERRVPERRGRAAGLRPTSRHKNPWLRPLAPKAKVFLCGPRPVWRTKATAGGSALPGAHWPQAYIELDKAHCVALVSSSYLSSCILSSLLCSNVSVPPPLVNAITYTHTYSAADSSCLRE